MTVPTPIASCDVESRFFTPPLAASENTRDVETGKGTEWERSRECEPRRGAHIGARIEGPVEPNRLSGGPDKEGDSKRRVTEMHAPKFVCMDAECPLREFAACTARYHEPTPQCDWNVMRDERGAVNEPAERKRVDRLLQRCPTNVVGEGKNERQLDYRFSWEEEKADTGANEATGAREMGGARHKPTPIRSPLVHDAWESRLAEHKDRVKVALLLDTIRNGANVGYDGPRCPTAVTKNHTTEPRMLAFLREETDSDIAKGRTLGWFHEPPFANTRFSPLNVVPKTKAGVEVGLRRIMDASAPRGRSLNDGIKKILAKCQTWTQVLAALKRAGKNAMLVKRDIKSAFRHIAIREVDLPLHGISVDGDLACEATVAFGVRTSPPIWDRIASGLTWILQHEKDVKWEVVYYVDDFLLVIPSGENATAAAKRFDAICLELGLTVAHEKDEGPTTSLVYTGTGIDTANMRVFVPPERKSELLTLANKAVEHATGKRVRTKEIASLVGKMLFACRAMPSAKPFCWQLLHAANSESKWTTIGDAERRDLTWWIEWLPKWSGSSMLNLSEWERSPDIELETDASLFGWGVVWRDQWACGEWTRNERTQSTRRKRESMPWMELYAITKAALIWGEQWRGRRITFIGDCRGLTQALNKNYLRQPAMAALLRVLSACAVRCEFEWRCRWIVGEANTRADALSRGRVQEMLAENPRWHRSPARAKDPARGDPLTDPHY